MCQYNLKLIYLVCFKAIFNPTFQKYQLGKRKFFDGPLKNHTKLTKIRVLIYTIYFFTFLYLLQGEDRESSFDKSFVFCWNNFKVLS